MNASNVPERLEQYLRAQLADKEAEKLRLDGEISAIQCTLTVLRQFVKQGETDAKA